MPQNGAAEWYWQYQRHEKDIQMSNQEKQWYGDHFKFIETKAKITNNLLKINTRYNQKLFSWKVFH